MSGNTTATPIHSVTAMIRTFSLSAAFFLSLGLMVAVYAQLPLA